MYLRRSTSISAAILIAAASSAVAIDELDSNPYYTCAEPYTLASSTQNADGTWTVLVQANCFYEP